MMRVANTMGWATCWAVVTARSGGISSRGRRSRTRSMASATTMAPSTMTPKSMAPSENRLAGIPIRLIRMNTTARATGMVAATITATGALPRNRMRMMQTSTTPSMMVCATLSTVAWTRLSRSI